jgi:hypothetical protein
LTRSIDVRTGRPSTIVKTRIVGCAADTPASHVPHVSSGVMHCRRIVDAARLHEADREERTGMPFRLVRRHLGRCKPGESFVIELLIPTMRLSTRHPAIAVVCMSIEEPSTVRSMTDVSGSTYGSFGGGPTHANNIVARQNGSARGLKQGIEYARGYALTAITTLLLIGGMGAYMPTCRRRFS